MDLSERVARLERAGRLWRAVAVVTTGLLLSGALAGAGSPPQTLRVGRLELVDAKGETRAVLECAEVGPRLILLEEKKPRLVLGHQADGIGLMVEPLRSGEARLSALTKHDGTAAFFRTWIGRPYAPQSFCVTSESAARGASLLVGGDDSLATLDVGTISQPNLMLSQGDDMASVRPNLAVLFNKQVGVYHIMP